MGENARKISIQEPETVRRVSLEPPVRPLGAIASQQSGLLSPNLSKIAGMSSSHGSIRTDRRRSSCFSSMHSVADDPEAKSSDSSMSFVFVRSSKSIWVSQESVVVEDDVTRRQRLQHEEEVELDDQLRHILNH